MEEGDAEAGEPAPLGSRKKIAWRPLVLQVHLSNTRTPRKSERFCTAASCSSGRKSCTASRAGCPGNCDPNCFPGAQGFLPRPSWIDKVRRVGDNFLAHLDHFHLRHAQSQPRRQTCCKHFVRQNSQMLGIVLEFDDVVPVAIAAHQLGLRAAPHPPHMLDGQLHAAMLVRRGETRKKENCSAMGRRSGSTGNLFNMNRNETGRMPADTIDRRPRGRSPRPSTACLRSANLLPAKNLSASCGAWQASSPLSWPAFSWPLFWEPPWPLPPPSWAPLFWRA